MRPFCFAVLLCGVLPVGGCRSAYVEATVVNRTDKPLRVVEIDYPSASFGTQALGAGAEFHYRFKVLGTGSLKLTYTDASFAEKTVNGPELREGDEGKLTVTVGPGGAAWQLERGGPAR